MQRRVVITGLGVISPIGVGWAEFWENCLAGVSRVEPIPEHWHQYTNYTSTIWSSLPPVDYSAYNISRTEELVMDPSSKLSCASAYMALMDAGYELVQADTRKNRFFVKGIDSERWGVFWGTGAGGVCTLLANNNNHKVKAISERLGPVRDDLAGKGIALDGVLACPERFSPFAVSTFMPNSPAANIGIKYTLHGKSETPCSACAAGTVAIGRAFSEIRSGSLDCAVTGGAEYIADASGAIFRAFDVSGALVKDCDDPQTANRPFDRKRSGFLFSEGGSGALILEELSHAEKRGARIIAELTAFDQTFDAHSIMMIEPSGSQIRRLIGNCLDQCGSLPGEIDYINAHGTGTELNDKIEAEIIFDMFDGKPLVNSTKSLIGHTIGASGVIEAIVTALSVKHDITHGCKNLEDPVNDINFVRQSVHTPLKKALTHSFAFGGHNAGLIIEKYSP